MKTKNCWVKVGSIFWERRYLRPEGGFVRVWIMGCGRSYEINVTYQFGVPSDRIHQCPSLEAAKKWWQRNGDHILKCYM